VDHELTVASHPSETEERMMVRILAFVLCAPGDADRGDLAFGKDLCDPDGPALSQHDLTGQLVHWIDLGQPDERRILRAAARAERVSIFSYSASTHVWWEGLANRLTRIRNVAVWQIPAEQSEKLARLAERSMDLQVTVQDGTVWVGNSNESVEITLIPLLRAQTANV
jgi:uncharacterized protein YaeQ